MLIILTSRAGSPCHEQNHLSAIAGILGRHGDEANFAALTRMSDAMHHRGPDGAGEWNSPADENGNGCFFSHRKLNVLDIADQPLARDGKVLVSDASIFTHPQATDVLSAMTRPHREALRSFRGMFAIAMWDDSKRQLLLARDPLGHKPLYFCRNSDANGSWSFAFASEVRALIASGLLGKPKLDSEGLASLVWNGFVMSPRTIVAGVSSLMPGEALVVDARGKEISRDMIWSMPRPEPRKTNDESQMRQTLRDAVKLQLQTAPGAPLGVFLSGGIDSGAIANLAQQQSGEKIHTFCMAMEDPALSEADAARAIARAMGTEHHEVTMTEARFVAALDAAIASLDQPTFDALNQYHICKAVNETGVKVALGGIGGDAIFGGDKTLRELPKMQRIANAVGWVPESLRVAAAKLIATMKDKSANSSPLGSQQNWAKLPDVARAGSDLLHLYQLTYALFLPDFQHELLGSRRAPVPLLKKRDGSSSWGTRYGLPAPTHVWLRQEIAGHEAIDVAAILETRCFVGERLLRDADTVSSSLSMELRSPLSDAPVIDELNHIPTSSKFIPVGYKPLLRRYGLEGLDPKLFDRPKSGFVMPFEQWIRTNLGQVMNEVMRDERLCANAGLNGPAVARLWDAFQQKAPGLYWTRVWAIYVLIRWCDRYGVSI